MYGQYNFVQHSVHLSLNCLGVIRNPKHRIAYIVIFIGIALFLITGGIVGLLAGRKVSERLQAFPSLILISTVFLMFIDSLVRRDSTVGLLKRLKNRHRGYVLDRANTTMKRSIMWYFVMLVSLFFIASVYSLAYYANPRSIITNKNSLSIPYWFSCGDHYDQKINATQFLICLPPARTRSQLVLVNALITSALGVMVGFACSLFLVYIVSVNELSIHAEIFASMVRNLNATMEAFHQHKEVGKWSRYKISRYQQNTHHQLIKIIRYQQFIKSCILKSISAWKTFNALYVCHLSVNFALILFLVMTEKDKERLLVIRATCFGTMSFVGLVLLCTSGHTISNLNEILFNELCTIPWYQQNTSIQFRRLYIIMLTQNLRSNDIKVLGAYSVNLRMIFSLMKNAYSLLNGLRLVSK